MDGLLEEDTSGLSPHAEEEEGAEEAKKKAEAGAPQSSSTGAQPAASSSFDESKVEQPDDDDDEELRAMKRKVQEMQEEADRIERMQKEVEEQMSSSTSQGSPSTVNQKELDARSVFVGNVDFGSTAEELQAHFQACGVMNRVRILVDKYSGQPKGYAYIEFAEEEAVSRALALHESLFRGRQLKVVPKRTNMPGYAAGRGGGFRGRPPRGFYGYYRPRRGRRPYYHPYIVLRPVQTLFSVANQLTAVQ